MGKITKVKLPKSGLDHYFVAGDWHSYHVDDATVNELIRMAKRLPKKKRKLIINGDFLDVEYLMKKSPNFKQNIKRMDGMENFFIPELEAEFAWGNLMLDQLQKVFSEIIYIGGNHDCLRIREFKQKFCPTEYQYYFNLRAGLKLKERGIKLIQYGNWLDVGQVSITHGSAHGVSACKKHYEMAEGQSVIFSHVHKLECRPFTSRGDTRQVWSLPAACNLNPDYMRGLDSNWSNGFGLIIVRPNGKFNFNAFQVWDGTVNCL